MKIMQKIKVHGRACQHCDNADKIIQNKSIINEFIMNLNTVLLPFVNRSLTVR